MTTEAPDGRADPIDSIFKSLDNSEWGRRNLPRLVSLLTHDRARVRTGAGWAITFVAAEHPDSAPYLIRRLGDRLTDEDVPLAVEQAFFAVSARYPDVADEELPEVLESDDVLQFERELGGSMLRADYAMGGSRNRDIGRVRFPSGVADDARRIYTNDGEEDRWRVGEGESDGAIGGESDGATGDEGDETAGGEGADAEDGVAAETPSTGPPGRPARELWAQTNHLAVIAADCRFDDLAVMAQRHRGRYADAYRTRADLDGEELAVGLLLFREPDEDVAGYVDALDEALGRWHRVDGIEGVRTLYDWGNEPRPWALVEYAAEDLGDQGRHPSDAALWNAKHLATSLTHVHEHGVVHAGVDPGNVSYYGNLLDADERQTPMFTNVCLLSVVRQYFDPTTRLDPRYAAPEYFDRRFGRIDHASDIYGLGAVCYHLFTGRPPYHGDYASVREAVLSPTPPAPSAVADVPDGVDEIVGKAMGTEKLHRYESVSHMAADLRALGRAEYADELLEPADSSPAVDEESEESDGERPEDDR